LLAQWVSLLKSTAASSFKQEGETIVFPLMSGKCQTLKVAGRDFACRAVAFFQTEEGCGNFTIALDDPDDDSHIITFSGNRRIRSQDDLYELPIDEMQIKSKDRPKVDGLPVPLIEVSTGDCRLVGSLASQQVSNILHSDRKNGKKFELRFDSDGSPMTVRASRPAISRRTPAMLISPIIAANIALFISICRVPTSQAAGSRFPAPAR
jgi:hypothetical protein